MAANLFGVYGRRSNPFTPRIVNNAAAYGQNAQQQQGIYNQYQPQQQQAISQYASLLRTDPNTDAYRTGQIAQATSGTTENYLRAQANIAARAARNGTVGGSMATGGANSADLAQAGAYSRAGNQFANQAYLQHMDNLSKLTGLYGNAAQQAYGNYNNALGSQTGVLSGLQSNFNQEEAQRAQEAAQKQQFMAQLFGLAGGIGGGL